MAIIQIFSHPEVRVFRSSICSKASFFSLLSLLLIVLPPFFIAFASRTFWLKEDSYRDTPIARFSHKTIVILRSWRGDDPNGGVVYRIFSTFDNLNLLHTDNFMPATIELPSSSSSSSISSSPSSSVNVKISLSPGDDFRVRSVTALFFFHYDLFTYTRVSMEGMAFLEYSSPTTPRPSLLWIDSEMRLHQNTLLPHRGLADQFNSSLVNATGVSLKDFSLKTILGDYKSRDLRLELGATNHLWFGNDKDASSVTGEESSTTEDGQFVVEGRFRFPEERVLYRPGVAQLLKWAWIQYLAIFVIFYFVLQRIKAFVFLNQIIPTIVESRLDKIRRH